MYRYFTELSFNGSGFHGWQIQPNASSVQETLEKALSIILKENIALTGCGRTDTGVHAKYYVAHFDCNTLIADSAKLVYKLNSMLSFNIVLYSITLVSNEAHARFNAIKREYEYHLMTERDPFLNETSYFHPVNLNFNLMNQAAERLLKHTDFTSFSKLHTDVKTNNCRVTKAKWIKQDDNYWIFYIEADRFLRNMVRAIVGTLLEVGKKRLTLDEFTGVIEAKDRSAAGTSVPGHALFLSNVVYSSDIFKKQAD